MTGPAPSRSRPADLLSSGGQEPLPARPLLTTPPHLQHKAFADLQREHLAAQPWLGVGGLLLGAVVFFALALGLGSTAASLLVLGPPSRLAQPGGQRRTLADDEPAQLVPALLPGEPPGQLDQRVIVAGRAAAQFARLVQVGQPPGQPQAGDIVPGLGQRADDRDHTGLSRGRLMTCATGPQAACHRPHAAHPGAG
jgi:hypothetical protein